MRIGWRGLIGAGLLLLLGARAGAAQTLLDWPVRTLAGTEALARGAAAAFANPAAAALAGRGEALVVDVSGPDDVGIEGLALAVAAALPWDFTVAAGFTHLGIDAIPLTTTDPTTGDNLKTEIDLGEDRFALALARPVGAVAVGGSIGYQRAGYEIGDVDGMEFGLGAFARLPVRFEPELSSAIRFVDGRARWMLGSAVALPVHPLEDLGVRVAYGAEGGDELPVTHRFSVGTRWRDRLDLSVGLDRESNAGAVDWAPAAAAAITIGRYEIGVVREEMPSGFGAAYYYRFTYRL